MRVTFWPVVGIAAFIALVLCGLDLAFVAEIFVTGAPHAIPRSPGLATVFFLLALLSVRLAGILLRRSIRGLSAVVPTGKGKQAPPQKLLYAAAVPARLLAIGPIAFPYVY